MDDRQLRLPMPVIGVQITLRRSHGAWEVSRRVLRQDQGWQKAGVARVSTQAAADLQATDFLADWWQVPPLD